jgi:hypothetical protein
MSTASTQTVRVRQLSTTRQVKTVAQELRPLWLTARWEDMVAAVSLALLVVTLLFLVVVG